VIAALLPALLDGSQVTSHSVDAAAFAFQPGAEEMLVVRPA
jgi:hypothetical protein